MTVKEEVHAACVAAVQKRIDSIRDAITEAQRAANEETKSSAGDKHETGRAMMQLETEKLHGQLELALVDMNKLHRIDPARAVTRVTEGAIVETDRLRLYFSVPAGNHAVMGTEYISLSVTSPMGMACAGKKKGDTFSMRGISFKILGVS